MSQDQKISKTQSVLDIPEIENLPEETEAERKKKKRIISKIMKEMMLQRKLAGLPMLMKENGVDDLVHVYEGLKKGKIKNLEMQINLLDENYNQAFLIRGGVSPDYIFKEIRDYTLADAKLIQAGIFIRDNQHYQLSSALIVMFSIIMKYFLGQDLDDRLAVNDVLELIDNKIIACRDQFSKEEINLINNLLNTLKIFEIYKKFEDTYFRGNQLKSENADPESIISLLHDLHVEYQDIDPRIMELLLEKPSHYESVLANLDLTVNQAIDLGILDQYKSKAQTEDSQLTICIDHSLLNNKKLLRRLNGSDLSKMGQDARKKIYTRFDKKILDLLLLKEDLYQFIKNTKSIDNAANELSLKYSPQIEKLIEDDQSEYNHKIHLESENIYDHIKEILKIFKKNNIN
ncbi:hypothetical protein [Acinetobacter sp. ANC 5502]